METIENALFLLTKLNDVYTLENKTSNTIHYILTSIKCNNENVIVLEGDLTTEGQILNLNLAKDGLYTLNIDGAIVHINYWVNNQKRLIKSVKKVLCSSCHCAPNDCNSEGNRCLTNQSIFNEIVTYINVIRPMSLTNPVLYNERLFAFYQQAILNNKCFVTSELCNQYLNISITGNTKNSQKLFNYYIAIYYLGLYFNDKLAIDINDEEQLTYLNNLYNFNDIKRCVQNLGVCIQDLEELFNGIDTSCECDETVNNLNINIVGILSAGTVSFNHGFLISELAALLNSDTASPVQFIIKTIPAKGLLDFEGTPVIENQIIPIEDVAGLFYAYSDLLANINLSPTSFNFQILDTQGNITDIGTVFINFIYPAPNFPPGKLQGFGADIEKGEIHRVLSAEFNGPAYADPEGDPLIAFKIINLHNPSYFTVTINGLPIVIGQEYLLSQLNNPSDLGVKVLVSPSAPSGVIPVFTYIGKDSGSNTYSEYTEGLTINIL